MRAVHAALIAALLSFLPGWAWAQAGAVAPGFTQASKDLKLSMSAAGRVESVLVREGDRVKSGQILLYLERDAEKLEVERRRLIAQDSAKLQEIKQKEKTLLEQVTAARALLESGGLSRKQVEDEEIAYRAAVSEREGLEVAKKREQVELALAEDAFEKRHLRSPIDGMVTKIAFREGESIAPHEPVIAVADISRVRFLGTVTPEQSRRIKLGSSVEIQLGTDTGAVSRKARIVFISPVTDAASSLVEVIAEFGNRDGSIRPGISGRLVF
jgi:RND family efflux transporter MFP subunit